MPDEQRRDRGEAESLSLRPGSGHAVSRDPEPGLPPGAAAPGERGPADIDPSLIARQAGADVETSLADAGVAHAAATPTGDAPSAGHVDAEGATLGPDRERERGAAAGGPVTSVGGSQGRADLSPAGEGQVDSTGGRAGSPVERDPDGWSQGGPEPG